MAKSELNFVVNAPSFDANSGGTIFLHELVNALNKRGERAALFPMAPIYGVPRRTKLKNFFRPPAYLTDPKLDTPIAKRGYITENTVAVYPEIVLGNPLGAKHVARWLLYTPGKKHAYDFGDNEMYFRVDEFADLPEVTGGAQDLFMWKVNRTYRNENRPERSGACFMVRKWGDGPRHPVTENAIQLDGKSHEEINDIFNQCEFFYSYDDATMYSQYAAICGCTSVVIPSGNDSRDEMLANHMLGQFGIAYGLEADKLAHANATKHKVIDLLNAREAEGERTVADFVDRVKESIGAARALQ